MTVKTSTAGITLPKKKKGFFRTLGSQYQLMIMSVPVLLYVLLFNYGPLWGWLTAFQDYNVKKGLAGSKWVGLDNFRLIFKQAQFLNTGIEGERRVQNVMVGEEPLDPAKTYTVAAMDYTLLNNGDGYTAFNGATVLQDRVKIDNQVLIDYIVDTMGGVVSEEYADPYGQGRIKILE